jgi:hypothetical protein
MECDAIHNRQRPSRDEPRRKRGTAESTPARRVAYLKGQNRGAADTPFLANLIPQRCVDGIGRCRRSHYCCNYATLL